MPLIGTAQQPDILSNFLSFGHAMYFLFLPHLPRING